MFKKFKDKLAEEVKSSPQRIQQFAQAAQAAVTSASSSITDITNNDLFSIGGDDTPTQSSPARPLGALGAAKGDNAASLNLQDASLSQTPTQSGEHPDRDATPTNDDHFEIDHFALMSGSSSQRLRKLSTGSAASDVSFRLPSYDSPNMYHLQSDMEVSEAESVPGSISLERVTKDQLYSAYRRTQERSNKYRARYSDLAKHYKILERENAKARAVLVETQDKALRRISELREQCTLEQSAKAHLENVLRLELDEKNFKIEALNTKINLFQNFDKETAKECSEPKLDQVNAVTVESKSTSVQNLIDLTETNKSTETLSPSTEIAVLNNKIQKMEQLIAKYKESLKSLKEKNSQLTTEIQIVSSELDKKGKENEQLQAAVQQLTEAREQIQELKELNSELENKIKHCDKVKDQEVSAVSIELTKAVEDIKDLKRQINVFTKREEENAISLAENKLSIHKELESKESEIKILTNNLKTAVNEIKSYELITDELKQSLKKVEDDKITLNTTLSAYQSKESVIAQLKQNIEELQKLNNSLEQKYSKLTEKYKCMELQMKQEEAEKLAIIDRNNYLETRNQQLSEDNSKKNKQIVDLEKEFLENTSSDNKYEQICEGLRKERDEALGQIQFWQGKHNDLEFEIEEERVELVKLRSEIEKMLHNYEKLQLEKIALSDMVTRLEADNKIKDEQLHIMQEQFKFENNELKNKLNMVNQEVVNITESMKEHENNIREQVTLEIQEHFNMKEKCNKEHYESIISDLNARMPSSENEKDNDQQIIELENKFEMLLQEKNKLEIALSSKQNVHAENKILKVQIQKNENELSKLHEIEFQLNSLLSEKNELQLHGQNLEKENDLLKTKADQIIENVGSLQVELSEVKKSHDDIEKEKDILVSKINKMEHDEANKNEKEHKLYSESLVKNKEVKKNVDKLKQELESLMAEKHKLNNQLLEAQYDLKEKDTEITRFKENSEVWEQKLASILDENNVMHEKVEKIKQEKDNMNETLLKLEQKALDYEKKLKQQEESTIEKEFLNLRTNQLENDLKFVNLEKDKLFHENQILTNEIFDLKNSESGKIKELTTEIEKSKIELDQVKTRLEKSVAQLEIENGINKEKSKTISKLEEGVGDLNKKLSATVQHMEKLKETETLYTHEQEKWEIEKNEFNQKVKNIEEYEVEIAILKEEHIKLKEERSRLMADIEGLQNHLTKVSKDNSQLNERLREMIANDESSLSVTDNSTSVPLIMEINKLKDDLRTRLDQIEDLERQNSILVEEKLELKDQIKSHNNSDKANGIRESTEKDLEITRLREKNNNLLEIKSQLESKLADLELIGRSGDNNVLHMEQKNEKLRLTNDKLERRLDEALVSLRHMRSLEENTELEYLRNILYEYLTGSGAHSITLAKVLAAVVKFDDRQTELVLQREKERQGLLGQLGLL